MKKVLSGLFFLTLIYTINAQSLENIKSYFPPAYGEWKLSSEFQIYNPENLFDYIDGAADNYVDFDFQELLVAKYMVSEEKYITIEIYEHKALPQAFGIYASERPLKGNFESIGAQGYRESGLLNFFIDRYYVKILSHDSQAETSETMLKIAQHLAGKLGSKPEMPESLKYFTKVNKVGNSEIFTNNSFLGYDFLKKAYSTSYMEGNKTFRIFIIENQTDTAALIVLKQYTSKLNLPFDEKEKRMTINDPHQGEIRLEWEGKFIWGIIDAPKRLKEDYLKLTRDIIFKK